jgi:hypothetical protein
MGGFQLFEPPVQPLQPTNGQTSLVTHGVGRFLRILRYDDVLQHQLETIIPFTTEEEIKDRGKSDGISKFIVLLQTSWFIIQCIARGIEHLPLTELEVVTLAYAVMNLFVYIFWWDKPYNVGRPIRVYANLTTTNPASELNIGASGVFEKIYVYVLGGQDTLFVLSQGHTVPMFWSGAADSDNLVSASASLVPSVLGVVFGALHCIAWSYQFPSHAELVLWRASCVGMMAVPVLSVVVCSFCAYEDPNASILTIFFRCAVVLSLLAWLYIAARIVTIVMAFTTLRYLPSEAFTVVNWTSFIPHI